MVKLFSFPILNMGTQKWSTPKLCAFIFFYHVWAKMINPYRQMTIGNWPLVCGRSLPPSFSGGEEALKRKLWMCASGVPSSHSAAEGRVHGMAKEAMTETVVVSFVFTNRLVVWILVVSQNGENLVQLVVDNCFCWVPWLRWVYCNQSYSKIHSYINIDMFVSVSVISLRFDNDHMQMKFGATSHPMIFGRHRVPPWKTAFRCWELAWSPMPLPVARRKHPRCLVIWEVLWVTRWSCCEKHHCQICLSF